MKETQIEIARAVGVSQPHLSEVLRGKKRPSPDLAEKLEKATGKHRLYFLYFGKYDEKGVPLRKRGAA